MDKDKIIELTNKIYRMTLLFPKKEPLRYKMREVADDVLAGLNTWEVFHNPNPGRFLAVENSKKKDLIFVVEKDFEILKSYFEVAKWQNWISYFDVLELEEEYDNIKSNFKKEIEDLEKEEKNLEIKPFLPTSKADGERVSAANVEKEISPRLQPEADLPGEETRIGREIKKLDPRKENILKILKEKGKAQVWEIKEILAEVSKRTLRRDFDQLLKLGLVERIGERNNTFYKLKIGH